MCKLKSVLVLKDRVFCPDYDSHDQMLQELGIEDNALNAQKTFVRVELSPSADDDETIFTPIDEWALDVDQDVLPEWFDAEQDRPRIVEAVEAWAKEHIFVGGEVTIRDKKIYVKDCVVTAWDNSAVTAYGNSTVTARDSSTVEAWSNSTVTARDSSTVTARGNSTVTARDSSTVTAWDNSAVWAYRNSAVYACGNSTVIKTAISCFSASRLTLNGNATFIDHSAKRIVNASYTFDQKLKEIEKCLKTQ